MYVLTEIFDCRFVKQKEKKGKEMRREKEKKRVRWRKRWERLENNEIGILKNIVEGVQQRDVYWFSHKDYNARRILRDKESLSHLSWNNSRSKLISDLKKLYFWLKKTSEQSKLKKIMKKELTYSEEKGGRITEIDRIKLQHVITPPCYSLQNKTKKEKKKVKNVLNN